MFKHDAVVRAWLDGKTVQIYNHSRNRWDDLSVCVDSPYSMPGFSKAHTYRIKPEVIQYKRWLGKNLGTKKPFVGIVHPCFSDPSHSEAFVRWIDDDWKTVEL